MRTSGKAASMKLRQRGATLLIGLIMLALLTLHAVAAFSTSGVQLRIAGNTQARQEMQAAANVAIGSVLSSGRFLSDPTAIAGAPVEVDVNDDGTGDYRVSVAATCNAARPVIARDLDPAREEDLQCLSGTAFGPATVCVDTAWNIQATGTVAGGAAATGAAIEINQGVTARIDAGDARLVC